MTWKTYRLRATCTAPLLLTAALAGAPLAASAQVGGSSQSNALAAAPGNSARIDWNKTVSVEADQANLAEMLRLIFRQVGVNAVVYPDAKKASVTAHMKNVDFRTALDVLLRQSTVPLTYRVENNVISILPKPGGETAALADGQISPFKRVSLEISNTPMNAALKLLFAQAGVNYQLDPGLGGTVTMSVKNVSFANALEQILKNSPTPLTARYENNIYSITKAEQPAPEPAQSTVRTIKIPGYDLQTNASAIAEQLRKLPRSTQISGLEYQAQPDNSLIVSYQEQNDLNRFRELIRLVDVAPTQVRLKAELILTLTDSAGKEHTLTLAPQVLTTSEHKAQIATTTQGDGAIKLKPLTLESSSYDLTMTPSVNGDGTISVTVDGAADFLYQVPGETQPMRIHQALSGSGRYRSGDTANMGGTVLKLKSEKGATFTGELLFFVTPTIIPDRPAGNPVGVPPAPK